MKPTVLIIDDDADYLEDLTALLAGDFTCHTARNGAEGLQAICESLPDAVILDLMLDGGPHGLEVLSAIREQDRSLPVLLATIHPSPETEAEALERGALYYVRKAAGRAELVAKLHRSLAIGLTARERDLLREEAEVRGPHGSLVGDSSIMQALRERIVRIAASPDGTVLITGESGSGKSLIAREIHRRSARRQRPFDEVVLAMLDPHLARDDLFGHRKGAYTTASNHRRGWFELVSGGTLCLAEIGDLPLDAQGVLLQAVEEHVIHPLGAAQPQPVDVRVLATTNRDLDVMVRAGSFRRDLLGRLAVLRIDVPPLREHPEDIPALARCFLERALHQMALPGATITPEAMERLQAYDWRRNNVRELRNRIESALVLHGAEGLLRPEAFELPPASSGVDAAPSPARSLDYNREKARAVRAFQRAFFDRLRAHLGRTPEDRQGETIQRMAARAGIPPQTVRRILRELEAPEGPEA